MAKEQPIQTLKEFRDDRGLSQKALAGALRVTQAAVSQWETGDGPPSDEIKKRFRQTYPGYGVREMMETLPTLSTAVPPAAPEPSPRTAPSPKKSLGVSLVEAVAAAVPTEAHQEARRDKNIVYVLIDPAGAIKYVCGSPASLQEALAEIALDQGWRALEQEVR